MPLPTAPASGMPNSLSRRANPTDVAGGQHRTRAMNFGWRELPEGARQADLLHASGDFGREAAPQPQIERGGTKREDLSSACGVSFEDVMTEILQRPSQDPRRNQPTFCFKCTRRKVSPAQ